MISKLRLTISLIFLLFCQFKSMGENFELTVSLEVLNNGLKKAILFSNQNGEILHYEKFKKDGYTKDTTLIFYKDQLDIVHLSILSAPLSFKTIDEIKLAKGAYLRLDKILTYIDIPSHLTLFQHPEHLSYYPKSRIFFASIPGKAQYFEPAKFHVLKVKGVFELNDIMLGKEKYRVNKKKIKSDSVLKFKFDYFSDEDFSAFIKINGEDFYRHINLSASGDFPDELHIDDLEKVDNIVEIKLPFRNDWKGKVSYKNLETEKNSTLLDFKLDYTSTGNTLKLPYPKEVLQENMNLVLYQKTNYGNNDTLHLFTQKFDNNNSEILFHNDFGFFIEKDNQGIVIEKNGEVDVIEVDLYLPFQEIKDFKFADKSVVVRSNSYLWKVVSKMNLEGNIIHFELPKIPKNIIKHVNFHDNLGEIDELYFGDIQLFKFKNPIFKSEQMNNKSYFFGNKNEGSHRIIINNKLD